MTDQRFPTKYQAKRAAKAGASVVPSGDGGFWIEAEEWISTLRGDGQFGGFVATGRRGRLQAGGSWKII